MSFKTSYKTVNYQTNLPYNCIYYVPGKDEEPRNEVELGLLPSEQGMDRMMYNCGLMDVEEVQGFKFHFCLIRPEKLLDETQHFSQNRSEALAMHTLRTVFPISERGYYVVNLLPEKKYLNDGGDVENNTLLIGTPNDSSKSSPMSFALLAANANFERMMGMTWSEFKRQEEAYEREIQDSYENMGGMMSFQTIGSSRESYAERVVRNQERIKYAYLKKFAELSSNPESTFEHLKEHISTFYDKVMNSDKLWEPCPLKLEYCTETDEYEVMLYPSEKECIFCDFGRGPQTKALYIFFLRHPDGIQLKELEKNENLEELALIYKQFKIIDYDIALQKMKSLASPPGRSQAMTDIRKQFEGLFVKPVASQYYVVPLESQRNSGHYGIILDSTLIDMDDFSRKMTINKKNS